ncbi:hypothetical protein ACI784_06265 [Geodermatophilus sp. SYSU D01186]
MTRPQASVDRPTLLLGVAGTIGAVTVLAQGEWLWAAVVLVGSMVAELLLVLARRRRRRHPASPERSVSP